MLEKINSGGKFYEKDERALEAPLSLILLFATC